MAIAKGSERVEEAEAGEEVTLVLDGSTFYAESGGQVGDTGIIESDDASLKVIDTKRVTENSFMYVR